MVRTQSWESPTDTRSHVGTAVDADDERKIMSTHDIECEIQIDAPIEVVWRTITEPKLIELWFADGVDLNVHSDTLGTLTFCPDSTEEPKVAEVTVVDVDPPHLFSYRWDYPAGVPATAENSLLVTFTLIRQGDSSTLFRVVESGLERRDWSNDKKQDYAADHRKGWKFHSERLAKLDFNDWQSIK
jgi:uncharacterized protein YndB with AHSA1/START domain